MNATFLRLVTSIKSLQLLGVKKIAGSACDRYRLLVSDGHYSNSFAMLATHLNTMVYNRLITNKTEK
jgi:hypothetical protein